MEIVEADSDRTFARHMHEHFGIGLLVREAQRSASGRGQVEATAGDLISVNPAEVHDGAPVGNETRRWQMLYFDPLLIAQAFKDMQNEWGHLCPGIRLSGAASPCAAELFRTLYQALAQAEEFGAHLKIEESLVLLLEHLLNRSMPISSLPKVAANRAKTLIDDDQQSSMSLALLAREAD